MALPQTSMVQDDHRLIRLRIADLLQAGGWNVATLPEPPLVRNPPAPCFLAIAPARDRLAPRLQVYLRRPHRRGRLGVGNLVHVVEAARSIPNFHTVVVSDRGFTPSAQNLAGDHEPQVLLFSPDELAEYLLEISPITERTPADHGLTCSAEIVITSAVTAELLAELAESRSRLEEVLRTCTPRFLEELVAANWEREGFEVEIVHRLNAGGPDVIATRRDSPVPLKMLTSVKWRSGERAIKRLDVSELLAWVEQVYPANAGLLATNSLLQSGAMELIQRFHRLGSMDRADLLQWTAGLWRGRTH